MKDIKKGHVHHGKTSKDVLSSKKVLEAAGLKSGDTFLDAGCGEGYISLTASDLVGENGKIFALDVHPESIAHLKEVVADKNIKNLNALTADLTDKIPLNDDVVDVCVMANVMHGFTINEEVDGVMREIKRVVKSDGIFAVVEFKKIEASRGPPYNIRIAPQELADLLSRYGFETVETTDVGEFHYLLKSINRKK